MIYEPDGRTPWMLLEVVNGFVMRSENANTAGPIPGKYYLRLRSSLC